MISLALYKPDIPQNTASIIRLCACLGAKIHIIEPCGFNLSDTRFKRVVMDYFGLSSIIRYETFEQFLNKNKKSTIVLMTTRGKMSLYKYKFKKNDIILLGRESKGVPDYVHNMLKHKLKIPIMKETRSLNVSVVASISLAEAIRQTKKI